MCIKKQSTKIGFCDDCHDKIVLEIRPKEIKFDETLRKQSIKNNKSYTVEKSKWSPASKDPIRNLIYGLNKCKNCPKIDD